MAEAADKQVTTGNASLWHSVETQGYSSRECLTWYQCTHHLCYLIALTARAGRQLTSEQLSLDTLWLQHCES